MTVPDNPGPRSLGDRLISPHGFAGHGPTPPEITASAKRLAALRVKFLTTDALGPDEIREVLDAFALWAEWVRELFEVVHESDIS